MSSINFHPKQNCPRTGGHHCPDGAHCHNCLDCSRTDKMTFKDWLTVVAMALLAFALCTLAWMLPQITIIKF